MTSRGPTGTVDRMTEWHDAVMDVVVVADHGDTDPGWVGERLRERGAVLRTALRGTDEITDRLIDDADVVLLLGSDRSVAHDPGADAVVAEAGLVRAAVQAGVPVIGICYGAQLSAHALGGSVRTVEQGEVGWYEVSSHDPRLCPSGPWLQFHTDVFTPPPGARLLGESPVGPQGFSLDGVVAWQFHPETTPSTLRGWVRVADGYVRRQGTDPSAFAEETEQRAAQSREAAHLLVDAALEHLGLGESGRS